MRFTDAHVEEPGGELLADLLQLVALAHCGREHRHPLVPPHAVADGSAGRVGVGAGRGFLDRDDAVVVVALERRGRVEEDRVFLGRLEAMPLLSEHVQEDGPLLVLDQFEVADQVCQRMPLDGAEVPHAHRFEERAAVERRFQRVLHVDDHPLHLPAHHGHALDHLLRLIAEAAIPGVGADHVEIFGEGPHSRADRHPVVVEDHDQPLLEEPGIVERLEHDARGQCPVANDGHRAAVAAAAQVVTAGQSEGSRHAGAGVTGHEQVVGALVGVWVAHQAALGPDRADAAEAAGDQLVRIDLVAGVPDQPVATEVEDLVQRQAELHDSQIGGKVGRTAGRHLAERFAHLGGELLELLRRKPLEIPGRHDGGKDRGHGSREHPVPVLVESGFLTGSLYPLEPFWQPFEPFRSMPVNDFGG